MTWFYLSFAGEEGFRGGAYVRAVSMEQAVTRSWFLEINPGGEVGILGPFDDEQMDASPCPPQDRERLLTLAELEAQGPVQGI